MTFQQKLKYAIVCYIVDIVVLLFFIDTEELKSHEIQVA